jgi:hypothetical protein
MRQPRINPLARFIMESKHITILVIDPLRGRARTFIPRTGSGSSGEKGQAREVSCRAGLNPSRAVLVTSRPSQVAIGKAGA